MGEKIIQPPFYNSGFYNTGNGGGGGGGGVVIGGRSYTSKIMPDGKEWLTQNLDFKFCLIGAGGSPAYAAAWYYNNDENTYSLDGVYKCGLLYNSYAVRVLQQNKKDLIDGWHVPTSAEWDDLINACGGTSNAGKNLKLEDGGILANWPSGWNGLNTYGFNIIPCGKGGGSFEDFNTYAYFKTSTESGGSTVTKRFSSANSSYSSNWAYADAMSIRLVKD